jgi:hypothetical protein
VISDVNAAFDTTLCPHLVRTPTQSLSKSNLFYRFATFIKNQSHDEIELSRMVNIARYIQSSLLAVLGCLVIILKI